MFLPIIRENHFLSVPRLNTNYLSEGHYWLYFALSAYLQLRRFTLLGLGNNLYQLDLQPGCGMNFIESFRNRKVDWVRGNIDKIGEVRLSGEIGGGGV